MRGWKRFDRHYPANRAGYKAGVNAPCSIQKYLNSKFFVIFVFLVMAMSRV
jgi:hypothetical protein